MYPEGKPVCLLKNSPRLLETKSNVISLLGKRYPQLKLQIFNICFSHSWDNMKL